VAVAVAEAEAEVMEERLHLVLVLHQVLALRQVPVLQLIHHQSARFKVVEEPRQKRLALEAVARPPEEAFRSEEAMSLGVVAVALCRTSRVSQLQLQLHLQLGHLH
jgi:hypothetical protein